MHLKRKPCPKSCTLIQVLVGHMLVYIYIYTQIYIYLYIVILSEINKTQRWHCLGIKGVCLLLFTKVTYLAPHIRKTQK